ncbi:MAG: molybdate ABC transporter substrate-binding protein [Peptococcaceae bacterium]|nr:molybdate ABC transporter substrate-binding protein [Peptococcaceae bacterium]
MRVRFVLPAAVILLSLSLAAGGCAGKKEPPKTGPEPVNLTVSAAISMKEALEELRFIYGKKQAGVTVTYNFASSGTLQKQIEEGAPVDIFISAGETQMDAIAQQGLIVESTRKDLLANELVLIAGKNSGLTGFDGLTGQEVTRISIGAPETVPAGKYARETLVHLQLWDKLQDKLVLAKDVRQVLTYVETGNVDAGLVYRTDAISGQGVRIVAAAPAGSHRPIVYPAALIRNSKHPEEAKQFFAFLFSDEAARTFEKHGFKVSKK